MGMYPRQYTMKPITLLHQKDVCAEPTEDLITWMGQSVIKSLSIRQFLFPIPKNLWGPIASPPAPFTPVSTDPEVCAIEPVL